MNSVIHDTFRWYDMFPLIRREGDYICDKCFVSDRAVMWIRRMLVTIGSKNYELYIQSTVSSI